jgi:hypothetical protein
MKIKTTKIETLVDDIYKLFDPNEKHTVNEENLHSFGENIKDLLRTRLSGAGHSTEPLRFSKLGTPDRKLWYEANSTDREEMSPKTYFKFLYGDIIEQLVLFLCKESGHEVTHEQHEVEVLGVKGHVDCVIDGVTVDIKSASPFGFQKFKAQTVVEEDPFGYIPQLSGYSTVLTPEQAPAFLAFDKVSGELCLSPISMSVVKDNNPEKIIEHQKEVIAGPIPDRCYSDIPDGKSGNRKLSTECSYCHSKGKCWPGLRTFIYSNGPRYLTTVNRVPDVYEVTG